MTKPTQQHNTKPPSSTESMADIHNSIDGFYAEYASSGNSSCKRCKAEISKRSVRFAANHWASYSSAMVYSCFHFKCLTGGMLRSWGQDAESCIVTGLSPSDQKRVHDKITKLLSEASTTKRSSAEMSNDAKGKAAKKLRALEDQVAKYKGKEFQLNMESYHEFMGEMDQKKKDWKVDRVASDDAVKDCPDLNLLVNNVFWNDLALPDMPDLPILEMPASSKPAATDSPSVAEVAAITAEPVKQEAEDELQAKDPQEEEERFYNEVEAKKEFDLIDSDLLRMPYIVVQKLDSETSRVTKQEVWSATTLANYETQYNKKEAKAVTGLSDAKLDVIPFEEVNNPNHYKAKMRGYSRRVLFRYQKYHRELESYEEDLKAQKMFRQRMDELQTILVERGFPFLKAMMEKNPYLLQVVTKGYTDAEWRGRKKDLYKAKECAELVIGSFPVFQLFPWNNQSFVNNLCGVRYDRFWNIYYATRTQFEGINKQEVSKKLLDDIGSTKVFMAAFQDNASILAGFLSPADRCNVKEFFLGSGEPGMAEHFKTTAKMMGASWWNYSSSFEVVKEVAPATPK